jgi:hypothetical protein
MLPEQRKRIELEVVLGFLHTSKQATDVPA